MATYISIYSFEPPQRLLSKTEAILVNAFMIVPQTKVIVCETRSKKYFHHGDGDVMVNLVKEAEFQWSLIFAEIAIQVCTSVGSLLSWLC